MKKRLIWFLGACLLFLAVELLPWQPGQAQTSSRTPTLVAIGGALRFDNAEVFNRIIELAGGSGSNICVFPTASGSPKKNGQRVVDAFNQHGATAIFMPVAVKGLDVEYTKAVNDPALIQQVQKCTGIYFIGGDQGRITQALYTQSGDRTPMLDAIWDVFNKGGVVGGSSAGAAILSTTMFKDAIDVLSTLKVGVKEGSSIDRGLGFVGPDLFIDQHFLTRGRFARALVAMQAKHYKLGIGVDENTALVIEPASGKVDVIGYKGAIVVDLSEATTQSDMAKFNIHNAKLTYLDRGDAFNYKTKTITPSPAKQELTVNPNDPKYEPYFTEEIFTGDILENTAVVDLMSNLIDNTHHEAIGLSFSKAKDVVEPELGFEFKFYTGTDSIGYYTGALGGEDYTVENIHLDVTPMQLSEPLYQKS
ncbi:MAG TPA: cyanophycinase [Coleofasciculaceae cyanobacterium]